MAPPCLSDVCVSQPNILLAWRRLVLLVAAMPRCTTTRSSLPPARGFLRISAIPPCPCGDRLRGRLLCSPLFPRPSRGLSCPTRLRASGRRLLFASRLRRAPAIRDVPILSSDRQADGERSLSRQVGATGHARNARRTDSPPARPRAQTVNK